MTRDELLAEPTGVAVGRVRVGGDQRRGRDVALERGLYNRYVTTAGAIIDQEWRRALTGREFVGQCRRCDGLMQAIECPAAGDHAWYTAICNCCSAEVALRVVPGVGLRRSSRHDEMPAGAWTARLGHLKLLKDLARKSDGDGD